MKKIHPRFLCALCALAVLISALFPVSVLAAEGTDTAASAPLTTEDAREMQQADAAVTALTDSDTYADMTRSQRTDAAVEQLQQLAEQGLVDRRSIYVDEANGMVSFSYSCGALGGILVADLDEENAAPAASDMPGINLHELSNAPKGDLGTAMIYYAYTTGLLFRRTRTEPVILLTEESTMARDLYYSLDLMTHRVIKINGLYCITPAFFRAAYRGGQLKNTIVLSETCEFLGVDSSVDTSMADALLAGGAKAVAGYVNNVYTVYSRSMLWDTVNRLILGQTLEEAVQHAQDTYGSDDLVWYNAQGGRRPHAAAAYLRLFGDAEVRLIEPAETAAVQQAA